jgi:hypothetical protein
MNGKETYDVRQGGSGALVWPQLPPGWTETRGGRGGIEIAVTTLAASGPGSLLEAIETPGPRIIVFKVGGVIDLAGQPIDVREPYLTIAGETAPNPGITLIRGGITVRRTGHNTIIRHIRVRPGEAGFAKRSGWEVDGLATAGTNDVIFDHCSVTWSTDENMSANSGQYFTGATPEAWRENQARRVTFYRCIIGECLANSTHSKGRHSKGSLIGNNATDIAVIGNLFISNTERNPLFTGGARGAIINNYIHNPGARGISFGLNVDEWQGHDWIRGQLSVVGNVVRRGPSSRVDMRPLMLGWDQSSDNDGGVGEYEAYLNDNLYLDQDGSSLGFPAPQDAYANNPEYDGTFTFVELQTPSIWPSTGYSAHTANSLQASILTDVGARPWNRDAVDTRLIQEATNGTGAIIDSETEVEGYPS